MRAPTILVAAAIFAVSCGSGDEAPADAPAAAITLSDLAGSWVVTATEATSDSVLIRYDLTATGTTDGWTTTLPDREPMPVRVVLVDGDSVVAEAGPFSSALRPGVMVTTRTVLRPNGDMLTGNIRAQYATDGADSVMVGRLSATRKM